MSSLPKFAFKELCMLEALQAVLCFISPFLTKKMLKSYFKKKKTSTKVKKRTQQQDKHIYKSRRCYSVSDNLLIFCQAASVLTQEQKRSNPIPTNLAKTVLSFCGFSPYHCLSYTWQFSANHSVYSLTYNCDLWGLLEL